MSRHERFFLQFCYVLVVCGDPEKRAVMVRELRQRLPNVILLAVEDKGFCRCNSVRDLRATCRTAGGWSGCSWKRWRSQPTASWTWRT